MSADREPLTLYHNPRCSKSRAALELLRARGIEPRIVEYLKTPLSALELASLLRKLGMQPAELVRRGEEVYRERYAGRELDDAGWLAAMVEDPRLMERPVAVRGERAVLGRPPERVLELV